MKRQNQFDQTWCARGDIDARAPSRRRRGVAMLVGAALCVAVGVAHADVPTIADVAVCNQEAQDGFRGRSISPTSKDQAGAQAARETLASTAALPGATGHGTQSADPQIDGMDREGAKDAAYRAAYRVCMRKRGF